MEYKRKEANIQIGKRLREARHNLGRTQAEIAASFGFRRNIIGRMSQEPPDCRQTNC